MTTDIVEAPATAGGEAAENARDRAAVKIAFAAVAVKEITGHVRSSRFLLSAMVTVALTILAVHIRAHDYREAHQERNLFLQRWKPSVFEQIEREETVQVENARAMSPLAVLATGLEPVVPFRFASTKEGLRFGQSRGASNPIDVLLGHLDIAFIISTLLSLLCIAFTFDSISGERASGTLALALSHAVDRKVFFAAKVVGNALVIVICFVPAFLLAAILVRVYGIPMLNLGNWALFGALSLLYLLLFAAAGVAISALSGEPVDSALRSIFVWAVLVFVLPRAAGVAVNYIVPPSRLTELAVREDAELSQLRLDYSRRVAKAVAGYLDGDGPSRGEQFSKERRQASETLRTERRKLMNRMWEAQRGVEDHRDRWVRLLSAVSPTAVFQQAASELAWTGREQRKHFLLEARTYDEKIGRRLAESREYYGNGSRERGSRSIVLSEDVRPYLVPFRPTWVPSSVIHQSVALPVLLLAAMSVVIVWLGQRWFAKLDVRG